MSTKEDSAAIFGVGAAACAVCCAGPIVGFLAAIGIGAAAGFALFGLIGLTIAAGVGAWHNRRRQLRRRACLTTSETVTIEPPALTSLSMKDFVPANAMVTRARNETAAS